LLTALPEYAVFREKIKAILPELYDLLAVERPDVFSRTSSESPSRSETISEQEEEDDNFRGLEGSSHSKSALKSAHS